MKEMNKEEMEKQAQEGAKCTYDLRVLPLLECWGQVMFRRLNAFVTHQTCPLIWVSLCLDEAILTRISGQGFRESRRRMRKRKSEDDGTGWVYLVRNELSVVSLYKDAAVRVVRPSHTSISVSFRHSTSFITQTASKTAPNSSTTSPFIAIMIKILNHIPSLLSLL